MAAQLNKMESAFLKLLIDMARFVRDTNKKFGTIRVQTKTDDLDSCIRALRYFANSKAQTNPHNTEGVLVVVSRIYDLFDAADVSMKDISLTLSAVAKANLSLRAKLPGHQHASTRSLIKRGLVLGYSILRNHPDWVKVVNIVQILNALSRFKLSYNKIIGDEFTYFDVVYACLGCLNSILAQPAINIKPSEIKVIFGSLTFIMKMLQDEHKTKLISHPVFTNLMEYVKHAKLYSTDAEKEEIPLMLIHMRKLCTKYLVLMPNLLIPDKRNPFITLPYIYLKAQRDNKASWQTKNLSLMCELISDSPYKNADNGKQVSHQFFKILCPLIKQQGFAQYNLQTAMMILTAITRASYLEGELIDEHLKYVYQQRQIFEKSKHYSDLHEIICIVSNVLYAKDALILQNFNIDLEAFLVSLLYRLCDQLNEYDDLASKKVAHLMITITKHPKAKWSRLFLKYGINADDFIAALIHAMFKNIKASDNPIAILNCLEHVDLNYSIPVDRVLGWKGQSVTIWGLIKKALEILRASRPALDIVKLNSLMASLVNLRVHLDRFDLKNYIFLKMNAVIASQHITSFNWVFLLHFIAFACYEVSNDSNDLFEKLIKMVGENRGSLSLDKIINILFCLTILKQVRLISSADSEELTQYLIEHLQRADLSQLNAQELSELLNIESFHPGLQNVITSKMRDIGRNKILDQSTTSISQETVGYCLKSHYSEFAFQENYYCEKAHRVIDFVLLYVDRKIAIEVDGGYHLIAETQEMTVRTKLRNVALLTAGWELVILPIWQLKQGIAVENITSMLGQHLSPLLPKRPDTKMFSANTRSVRMRFSSDEDSGANDVVKVAACKRAF